MTGNPWRATERELLSDSFDNRSRFRIISQLFGCILPGMRDTKKCKPQLKGEGIWMRWVISFGDYL